jgi:hypothetical protein
MGCMELWDRIGVLHLVWVGGRREGRYGGWMSVRSSFMIRGVA